MPDDARWHAKSFNELAEAERQAFWDYKVVVRELKNANDLEIRDLFARLNTNNISLNDQELRNARFVGKFKQAAERLADNPVFASISLFTAKEVRRMEDIEYVSELLLLVVAGVTNKKDLLEDAYAQFDEEFPREAAFEGEFNAAVQLLLSLTSSANTIVVRTKSNFYSVFGACLRYFRITQQAFFRNAAQVSQTITDVLIAARNFDVANPNPDSVVQEYYDAVSRAASDRNRRFRREEILWDIIRRHEDL